MDSCACGVTGTCVGGTDDTCNCDISDDKLRVDGGWIVDKTRMPVCEVCMELDPVSNDVAARLGMYALSNLYCSDAPIGGLLNMQFKNTLYVIFNGIMLNKCGYIPVT